MSLPHVVGSTLASAALDGASFVWSQWQTPSCPGKSVETWNININMGATTATMFLDIAYSAAGTVFSTSAINSGASIIVGALSGYSAEAIAGWFYNLHFGATTTIKAFYVVGSRAEASVT
jgi:hypothetical protein